MNALVARLAHVTIAIPANGVGEVSLTVGAEPRTRIYVEDGYARPQIREISEISEAVRGLRRGYELHRVCFPAEVKDEVYRLYHSTTPPGAIATGV